MASNSIQIMSSILQNERIVIIKKHDQPIDLESFTVEKSIRKVTLTKPGSASLELAISYYYGRKSVDWFITYCFCVG
jgi:hypothetical protein